jgi:hypothetical protein
MKYILKLSLMAVAHLLLLAAACNSNKSANDADTTVKDTAVLDTSAVVVDSAIHDTAGTFGDTTGNMTQ